MGEIAHSVFLTLHGLPSRLAKPDKAWELKGLRNGRRIAMMPTEVMVTMRAFLVTTCVLTGALLAGGCATKKYVRNTAAPIQAKVDQVGDQTTQNSQQIQDNRGELKTVDERAPSGISAAQERANSADQHAATADQHAATADQHAGEALARANQVDQAAQQGISSLRTVIANIDDFKLQSTTTVPFQFNRATLNP